MSGPTDIARISFQEVETLPPFGDIGHGELLALSLRNNTAEFTHPLHRFPAKFVPQIPGWALDQFATSGSTTLDPFMGSGTTLVEGALRGGTCIGIDLDPLACLIAAAKTNSIPINRLEALGRELDKGIHLGTVTARPPMADIRNFSHWFSKTAWEDLQRLRHVILKVGCSCQERDFLLAVFSSVLRWVSNADDQSHKTYVSHTRPKTPPQVFPTFWRALSKATDGCRELQAKKAPDSQTEVRLGDARDTQLESGSIDLVVTSPPYLDSVDYMYNFMLEYFWLGPLLGVPTRRAFNERRKEYMGARSPRELAASIPKEVAGPAWNSLPLPRRRAAAAYFEGMRLHFNEMARVCKKEARYVLIVGNSQSQVGAFPVHDSLIRIAASAGWAVEKAFGYRIRRHYMKFPRRGRGGIILIDWVVVLSRTESDSMPKPLPLRWTTLPPHAVAH
jgi:DNA modification methylase